MPVQREDDWRRRTASSPFYANIFFKGEQLVLGQETVLCKLCDTPGAGAISVQDEASHDRMVALLAIAGQGRLANNALLQLEAALGDWRRGERGLAAIRLAFAPLPRLRDHDAAYRLFLAETALDAGMAPNDLLRELGYSACATLLKFDPRQPRVPSGSGARSGQWTSGTTGEDGGRGLVPVYFRPQPDGEDEVIQDKPRGPGIGESEKEKIEEGRALRFPMPGTIGGRPTPSVGQPGAAGPATGVTPIPRLKPAPGGSGATNDEQDEGPACPAQQNDRPRGPNANADAFEYVMSLIINPFNPTPKQSPATPNVVSQSYYLPTPTPDGKTSYDDCKQDGTPISVAGVRRGDMFEFKSANFGWQLDYQNSDAYRDFYKQVENQNEGVSTEGLGRKVFYCMGSQSVANKAAQTLGARFPNSRFLLCH